jgi:PAS domain S-box-containing protein
MKNRLVAHFIKRPVTSGLVVFFILLLLTQLLTYQRYLLRKDADQREIYNQAALTKERLQTVVNYCFSSTQTLAFIVENYGVPQNFDSVAKQLLNTNKYIDAVELVQGGTITHVYPLKGNEAVLGFNILLDSARKSGAITTIQKKEFFISGPINLKQGGAGFVGRIPIFKNNSFWGFSAVLIKLPTLLKAAGIDSSGNSNFFYRLAKVDVATGKEEFFLRHNEAFQKEYSTPVEIPNGEWRLYVIAGKNTTFSGQFIFVLLGFILSLTGGLFAWFIVKQPFRLSELVKEKTLQLRTSEKNYRITLERIADAFVAVDTNWCCTYMNSKAGEIFNCDPKTMIGKNIWTFFPGGPYQPFYAAWYKAMQQQQYISIEEHFQSSERWFENHIYPSPEGLSVFLRDITGRKKAEQQLRQSNERFQLISRATNDALWEWNFETGQLWGNETHQQLFGLTMADPVPGENVWKEHIHPDDRDHIAAQQVTSIISDKSVFITEYRFRLPNNEYCYIYDRCYIQRDSTGRALRMVGSMMDISEQKKAAQSLKEREEHLRIILQTDPECIKQLGPGAEVYDMNPAGLSMIEADSLDTIKNKSLTTLLLPQYKAPFLSLSKNVFAGNSGSLEFEIIGFKGTHRYLEMYAVPLKNAEGNIISLLGVTRDVTERKKIEQQIIKEKELSDSIINSLPGIFYLFSAERKLLRWNKNFETVSGYNSNEIVLITPVDFYEGEGRKMVQENFTKVMLEGKSQFEANFVTKHGDKVPYFFTGLRVEYKGNPCMLGTGIDVTLRKKAQEEIEVVNEQLHQLTQHLQNIREVERKRIARDIHDDLGQQLTGIKMGVEWINKKTPDEFADIKDKLVSIIALVNNCNVSVRKILNELRTDILDNYGIAEALEWQGRQFTGTTNIPLVFTGPEESLKVEEEVATCLFRIFQESLNNIAKYANASQVTSSLTYAGNNIVLHVSDNGTGFDPELLKSKKSFGILGMKERVAALNGIFNLESSPGEGTSITITIPFIE